jgi:hypothetical protein
MTIPGLAAVLMLSCSAASAGKGRILFVCAAGTATCELAAERFETMARASGWQFVGRAAAIDDLSEADLARASIVVAIDTPLYRRWLLSIDRFEAWTGVPPAEHDRAKAQAAIDQRLQALSASLAPAAAPGAPTAAACPARDYACFIESVVSLREGMARAEVERRLGAPTMTTLVERAKNGAHLVLTWSLDEFTHRRPAQPAGRVEVSFARDRVVQVRTMDAAER